MQLRRLLAVTGTLVIVCGAASQANAPATLLLTSGERVNGELVDMGGVDFTMTVANRERRIPIGDVVVIDFEGRARDLPGGETSQIVDGRHLLSLKGRRTFQGKLSDLAGTNPLRITFQTAEGAREFSSANVVRIYLARPPGAAMAVTEAPEEPEATATETPEGLPVLAMQVWTPTGMNVQANEMMSFIATGEITLSADPGDVARPAGSTRQRRAARAPLPQVFAGALLGRIGSGAPFAIGDQTNAMAMPSSGELFLGINDDSVGDNQGEFRVVVTRGPVTRRR